MPTSFISGKTSSRKFREQIADNVMQIINYVHTLFDHCFFRRVCWKTSKQTQIHNTANNKQQCKVNKERMSDMTRKIANIYGYQK